MRYLLLGYGDDVHFYIILHISQLRKYPPLLHSLIDGVVAAVAASAK